MTATDSSNTLFPLSAAKRVSGLSALPDLWHCIVSHDGEGYGLPMITRVEKVAHFGKSTASEKGSSIHTSDRK